MPDSGRHAATAALIDELIEKLEKKLKAEDTKGTMGDLIRLLQMQKELGEESPREVEVRWVEPKEEEEPVAER